MVMWEDEEEYCECCGQPLPEDHDPRFVESYEHLSPGLRAIICKRYGHQIKYNDDDKECLRCGVHFPLTNDDFLAMYFQRKGLEKLKADIAFYDKIEKQVLSDKPVTIQFAKWQPHN